MPDFLTEAWRKLCLNATAAPMVLEGRRAEVFAEPEALELAAGSPRSASPSGARRAPGSAGRGRRGLGQITALPPDLGTSMLFDRLAGRRLEWEARNGVIARLGARHAIPTPVSERVAAQLAALDPHE